MLNPGWYKEDSQRIPRVGVLYRLGDVCMNRMVGLPLAFRLLSTEPIFIPGSMIFFLLEQYVLICV